MNSSKQRFNIQIKKIKTLLHNANSQENPALWLYLNDLRTPFFMIEGLSKMYAELHNKKDFKKIKEQSKQIEDALGAVDYYIAFQKEFASNTTIPSLVKDYIAKKSKEKLNILNKLLINENWLNGKRIDKIQKRLKKADWLKEEKEIKAMQKYYQDEITDIIYFTKKTTFTFDNVEEDVHELRRKLRWLSIYPQALNGVVELFANKTTDEVIKKYLTEEITTSPFNQLITSKELTHFLSINKNNFLALSWMIAELGKIKDSGLRIKVLEDALQATEFLKNEEAETKTMQLLGKTQPSSKSLLQEASTISKTYFSEKLLTNLINQ
ncbi:hypothetical protein B0A58_14180 [Flavobacterium branchiophilum NBRC 15030 = ATCC 35035]|uniref:Uncharacterized protein n=2 Tax=Flavobacterium branchiophilum TaxID=55197 RepID=G2Z6W8_FLABF|nr:hypothetical protein [Flavobacterium branchiophilum]OXA70734.1 hypothetical protein B0A58_14180 [Flavobacterium branchiophilum NBRC 15030 = ATCC 35035]TQM39737.1 hypothetical protein BC670_0565 [Flavobacterium branchiophilum]GEM55221.1 hypothetical protein FB1_14420 [Flavobacterium branchiophilum NBRC 15030 = ATCC 35035]CCB68964.1 Hypothetical protein FBFL15_0862 [Flavobacterium branchiophilum FL-15]